MPVKKTAEKKADLEKVITKAPQNKVITMSVTEDDFKNLDSIKNYLLKRSMEEIEGGVNVLRDLMKRMINAQKASVNA